MEKDFRPLLLQANMQMPNGKSSAQQFHMGLQSTGISSTASGANTGISSTAPGANKTVSTDGNYPINELPLPPKAKEPHGWFYRLPCFRKSFISGANVLDEKPLLNREVPEQVQATTSGCSQKQFLVFDQCGDKTTLVCLNSWNSKSRSPYFNFDNSNTVKFEIWSEKHNPSGPNLTSELNANHSEAEFRSEMHEDSEEINALLYSDDENDDEEDEYDEETTSTGHSPGLATTHNNGKQDCFKEKEEEEGEEVASSGGPMKRQRISRDGYDRSLMDTASSVRADRALQLEDDARSICADDHELFLSYNDDNSMCGMKRLRKERIHEAVEILRSIIPDGKGKDSVMVLDESIRYLRSLKLKTKSLGLPSF